MKKYFFTIAVLPLVLGAAYGQSAFKKGQVVLQPGIGYGLIGTSGEVEVPPVSLCLEIGTSENLSFGGYVGYAASKEAVFTPANTSGLFQQDYGFKYTYFIFGGRGSYHFEVENNKLDIYAGVMLGYNAVSATEYGQGRGQPASIGASGFLYGGHGGVRYFLAPGFGVFAEAGYGIGYLTVGLSFSPNGKREAEGTIWQRWNDEFSNPGPAMEEEQEKEPLLQAQILDMKRDYLIIDLGQSHGLKTGMALKFYPSIGEKSAGKVYGTAVVTEARYRYAIVKISNSRLTTALAVGDKLGMTILPPTAEY